MVNKIKEALTHIEQLKQAKKMLPIEEMENVDNKLVQNNIEYHKEIDNVTTALTDKITNKIINIAEGTAGVHIPIGKGLKAGVTVGSLDLAYGGERQIQSVLDLSNLSEKERSNLESFKGKDFSSDIEQQKALEKEARGVLSDEVGSKVRSGLIEYNKQQLFNRLGRKGNVENVEETIWKDLNAAQQAALVGMRIKNQNIDYLFTDKRANTLPNFIKLAKNKMKSFNRVDRNNWSKYIEVLEEYSKGE